MSSRDAVLWGHRPVQTTPHPGSQDNIHDCSKMREAEGRPSHCQPPGTQQPEDGGHTKPAGPVSPQAAMLEPWNNVTFQSPSSPANQKEAELSTSPMVTRPVCLSDSLYNPHTLTLCFLTDWEDCVLLPACSSSRAQGIILLLSHIHSDRYSPKHLSRVSVGI